MESVAELKNKVELEDNAELDGKTIGHANARRLTTEELSKVGGGLDMTTCYSHPCCNIEGVDFS